MDFNLGGIQGWREIQNAVDALTDEVRSNGVFVGVAVSNVAHVTCTCPLSSLLNSQTVVACYYFALGLYNS